VHGEEVLGMGYMLLYIAFGVVALWLLGEVLLQFKARLRWRLLAFGGFVILVAGVMMPSVLVIVVGAVAFGAGQTFVTLSHRRGFTAGWALPMARARAAAAAPPAGTGTGSRRRRAKGAPAPAPTQAPAQAREDAPGDTPADPGFPAVTPDQAQAQAQAPDSTAVYQSVPLTEEGEDEFDAYGSPGGQDTPPAQPGYDPAAAGYQGYADPYQGASGYPGYDGYAAQGPYGDPYQGQYADPAYANGGQGYGEQQGWTDPYAAAPYSYDAYGNPLPGPGDTPPGGVWAPHTPVQEQQGQGDEYGEQQGQAGERYEAPYDPYRY
jgi:hypothetical protein